jgi:mannonate dehydratase
MPTFPHLPDGIKISLRIPFDPTDDDLAFVAQLGVDHVYSWFKDETVTREMILALRKRCDAHGLTLFNVGNLRLCKNDKIHLALPGRDEAIQEFCDYLRDLSAAGIHTTTFTWEARGDTTSCELLPARGGAMWRSVDVGELEKMPLSHGRLYSEDEIWENFTYFINAVIPVAEEVGVRLSLHPNDPPIPVLCGVPSLIHNMDCYRRAFEICDSDYFGMEFCSGCWLEGADEFGDMFSAIEAFVSRGKVFIAHFRNVSSPLPQFQECFIDDGYMDMRRVMQAFVNAGFQGTMVPDHADEVKGCLNGRPGQAYVVGYMKALLEREKEKA